MRPNWACWLGSWHNLVTDIRESQYTFSRGLLKNLSIDYTAKDPSYLLCEPARNFSWLLVIPLLTQFVTKVNSCQIRFDHKLRELSYQLSQFAPSNRHATDNLWPHFWHNFALTFSNLNTHLKRRFIRLENCRLTMPPKIWAIRYDDRQLPVSHPLFVIPRWIPTNDQKSLWFENL